MTKNNVSSDSDSNSSNSDSEKNNKKQSKPIISLNLTSGEEVEYESISSASKVLNLTISCIARIANGERKMSKKLNMTFYFKKFDN